MKKQLEALLKQGAGVDMWFDDEGRPTERFVVQVWKAGFSAVNYYGRTLAQAIKRAADDAERDE